MKSGDGCYNRDKHINVISMGIEIRIIKKLLMDDSQVSGSDSYMQYRRKNKSVEKMSSACCLQIILVYLVLGK